MGVEDALIAHGGEGAMGVEDALIAHGGEGALDLETSSDGAAAQQAAN